MASVHYVDSTYLSEFSENHISLSSFCVLRESILGSEFSENHISPFSFCVLRESILGSEFSEKHISFPIL